MLLRLGRLALAAILLAAWQAALEHPIEHVDELGEFVHLHSGKSHGSSHHKDSDAAPLCDALAAVTVCAAQTHAVHDQCRSDYDSPSCPPSVPRVADAPPFLSQGPPASV